MTSSLSFSLLPSSKLILKARHTHSLHRIYTKCIRRLNREKMPSEQLGSRQKHKVLSEQVAADRLAGIFIKNWSSKKRKNANQIRHEKQLGEIVIWLGQRKIHLGATWKKKFDRVPGSHVIFRTIFVEGRLKKIIIKIKKKRSACSGIHREKWAE